MPVLCSIGKTQNTWFCFYVATVGWAFGLLSPRLKKNQAY